MQFLYWNKNITKIENCDNTFGGKSQNKAASEIEFEQEKSILT